LSSNANGEFVQSLERGLAVVRSFSRDRPQQTLTEVAGATGLTRATARRFLMTLESLGYAASDGKVWRLTARVLDLGYSYLSSLGLPEVITPHLERLAATVHESASAAVLDLTDIVYVARVEGRKIMRVQITIGTRFPAYVTSLGRVLMASLDPGQARALLEASDRPILTPLTTTGVNELVAELERVRSAGYSLVDQELELGLRSIAVPLRDRSGQVVAAINVSTTATGSPADAVALVLPALREAQSNIEREIA
jgi:IclR family pca regulon transcriptional regulator